MAAENHEKEDALLRKQLQAWQVPENLPPRFAEQVWQRIARAARQPASGWSMWFEQIAAGLHRPALASAYLAVLIFAGLLSGYWHARVDIAQESQELKTRYIRLMDAYEPRRAGE